MRFQTDYFFDITSLEIGTIARCTSLIALKYEKLKNAFLLLGKYIIRSAIIGTNFMNDSSISDLKFSDTDKLSLLSTGW